MPAAVIQHLPAGWQLGQPGFESTGQEWVRKIIFLVAPCQFVVCLTVDMPDKRPFGRARREAGRVGVLPLENSIQFMDQIAHEAHPFFDIIQI